MIYDCHNDVFFILVVAGLCQFNSWRWDTARVPVPLLMLEDIFEDDRDQSCVMIPSFGGEVIFASKQKTFSLFCYKGPFVQPLQRWLRAETKVPSAPVGTKRQKKIPSSIHLWMSYHSLDRDQKCIKLTTLNSLLVRLCCC